MTWKRTRTGGQNFPMTLPAGRYYVMTSDNGKTSFNSAASSITLQKSIYDYFNRADNAISIGNADSGQTWGAVGGAWGILTNRAYTSAAGNVFSYVETGMSDVEATVDTIWSSGEGLVVRFIDTANYIVARISSTGMTLFKIVAGVATSLGNYAFTPVSGATYTIKIITKGSNFSVLLDGTQQIVVSETFNQSATKVGLRQSGTPNGYFDNFLVEAAV